MINDLNIVAAILTIAAQPKTQTQDHHVPPKSPAQLVIQDYKEICAQLEALERSKPKT
jgi:hypothetical protein